MRYLHSHTGDVLKTLILLFSLPLLAGCGGNRQCNDTCNRLYAEDQCSIQRPGAVASDLIKRCNDKCNDALDAGAGSLDGYDPYTSAGWGASIELENEMQAAVWMRCVSEQSCDRLEEGYCAPVW